MSQTNKLDITSTNGFEIGDSVIGTDYGHTGLIREFAMLRDDEINREWLSEQSKPWSDADINNVVIILDVFPSGSAIVPISRVKIRQAAE
jgi:hypothetical protein